eukprot:Nk52_evm36s2506 gene=Nk52_evmTU36s2506
MEEGGEGGQPLSRAASVSVSMSGVAAGTSSSSSSSSGSSRSVQDMIERCQFRDLIHIKPFKPLVSQYLARLVLISLQEQEKKNRQGEEGNTGKESSTKTAAKVNQQPDSKLSDVLNVIEKFKESNMIYSFICRVDFPLLAREIRIELSLKQKTFSTGLSSSLTGGGGRGGSHGSGAILESVKNVREGSLVASLPGGVILEWEAASRKGNTDDPQRKMRILLSEVVNLLHYCEGKHGVPLVRGRGSLLWSRQEQERKRVENNIRAMGQHRGREQQQQLGGYGTLYSMRIKSIVDLRKKLVVSSSSSSSCVSESSSPSSLAGGGRQGRYVYRSTSSSGNGGMGSSANGMHEEFVYESVDGSDDEDEGWLLNDVFSLDDDGYYEEDDYADDGGEGINGSQGDGDGDVIMGGTSQLAPQAKAADGVNIKEEKDTVMADATVGMGGVPSSLGEDAKDEARLPTLGSLPEMTGGFNGFFESELFDSEYLHVEVSYVLAMLCWHDRLVGGCSLATGFRGSIMKNGIYQGQMEDGHSRRKNGGLFDMESLVVALMEVPSGPELVATICVNRNTSGGGADGEYHLSKYASLTSQPPPQIVDIVGSLLAMYIHFCNRSNGGRTALYGPGMTAMDGGNNTGSSGLHHKYGNVGVLRQNSSNNNNEGSSASAGGPSQGDQTLISSGSDALSSGGGGDASSSAAPKTTITPPPIVNSSAPAAGPTPSMSGAGNGGCTNDVMSYGAAVCRTIRLLCTHFPAHAYAIRTLLVESRLFPELVIRLTIDYCSDHVIFLNSVLNDRVDGDTYGGWFIDYVQAVYRGKAPSLLGESALSLIDKMRKKILQVCAEGVNGANGKRVSIVPGEDTVMEDAGVAVEGSGVDGSRTKSFQGASASDSISPAARCAVLRLYCGLSLIEGFRLNNDEVRACLQLAAPESLPPTQAGSRVCKLGLCFMLCCVNIRDAYEDLVLLDWLKTMVGVQGKFYEHCGKSSDLFSEMILLLAIHFQNVNTLGEVVNLVRSTLGMPVKIPMSHLTSLRSVLLAGVFTEAFLVEQSVLVPVTARLSEFMRGFYPVHCILQLLKLELFAKHNGGNVCGWIFEQVCAAEEPLHHLLPDLLEVYVERCVKCAVTGLSSAPIEPLHSEDLQRIFDSSSNHQRHGISNGVDGRVGHVNVCTKILLMYYVLYFNSRQFEMRVVNSANVNLPLGSGIGGASSGRPGGSVLTSPQKPSRPSVNSGLIVGSGGGAVAKQQSQQQKLNALNMMSSTQAGGGFRRNIAPYSDTIIDMIPVKQLLNYAEVHRKKYINIYPRLLSVIVSRFPEFFNVSDLLTEERLFAKFSASSSVSAFTSRSTSRSQTLMSMRPQERKQLFLQASLDDLDYVDYVCARERLPLCLSSPFVFKNAEGVGENDKEDNGEQVEEDARTESPTPSVSSSISSLNVLTPVRQNSVSPSVAMIKTARSTSVSQNEASSIAAFSNQELMVLFKTPEKHQGEIIRVLEFILLLPPKEMTRMWKPLIRVLLPNLVRVAGGVVGTKGKRSAAMSGYEGCDQDGGIAYPILVLFKNVWEVLNTVMPQQLWAETVHAWKEKPTSTQDTQQMGMSGSDKAPVSKTFSNASGKSAFAGGDKARIASNLTHHSIVMDPQLVMRCDPRVFRIPALYSILLKLVDSYLVAFENKMKEHCKIAEASGKRRAQEELCEALVVTQKTVMVQLLLEVCQPSSRDHAVMLEEASRNRRSDKATTTKGAAAKGKAENQQSKSDNGKSLGTNIPTHAADYTIKVLQEINRLTCSFLHDMFIADDRLIKLVHFQGYNRSLIPFLVSGVPSLHTCIGFIPELVSQNVMKSQIFGILLTGSLAVQYPVPQTLAVVHLVLDMMREKVSGKYPGTEIERLLFFCETVPTLVELCFAFPVLCEPVIQLMLNMGPFLKSCNLSAIHHNQKSNPTNMFEDFSTPGESPVEESSSSALNLQILMHAELDGSKGMGSFTEGLAYASFGNGHGEGGAVVGGDNNQPGASVGSNLNNGQNIEGGRVLQYHTLWQSCLNAHLLGGRSTPAGVVASLRASSIFNGIFSGNHSSSKTAMIISSSVQPSTQVADKETGPSGLDANGNVVGRDASVFSMAAASFAASSSGSGGGAGVDMSGKEDSGSSSGLSVEQMLTTEHIAAIIESSSVDQVVGSGKAITILERRLCNIILDCFHIIVNRVMCGSQI